MAIESILKPKRPSGDGWHYLGAAPEQVTMGYEGHYWLHGERRLLVVSALEVAKDDGPEKGPEYHVSISRNVGGQLHRCSGNDAKYVVETFGLDGAEEDNHVPGGKVRNFWLPVAESKIGMECPCKAHEPAIVEDKGDYVWRGVSK